MNINLLYFYATNHSLLQQIAVRNPIVNPSEGNIDEVKINPLGPLIARLWVTLVIVGGLLLLLFLLLGALEWLTAGGDPEKAKKARGRITDAFIGMLLLVMSLAVVAFLKMLFGFDLLNISWPNL